jgi:hypothetical protein
MLELNAECKAKFRRLLYFSRGIEESALFPSPRRSTRARVSLPLVLARTHYEVILCHSGALDPSRLLTISSRVTNKSSKVITVLPTPPSRLADADHQE